MLIVHVLCAESSGVLILKFDPANPTSEIDESDILDALLDCSCLVSIFEISRSAFLCSMINSTCSSPAAISSIQKVIKTRSSRKKLTAE